VTPLLLLAACAHSPASLAPAATTAPAAQHPTALWQDLSAEVLEETLRTSPVTATVLGDHRFDALWPDVSLQAEQARLAWLEQVQGRLSRIQLSMLPVEDQVDAAILAQRIQAEVFTTTTLRPWETDPLNLVYTLSSGLDDLVSRDFAPVEQRMASLQGRLLALPAFVSVAQGRLTTPPQVHTETALAQTQGLVAWVDGPLREQFPPAQAAALNAAADQAEQSLRDLQAFLQDELLPRSTADFRLGPALYGQKLQYTLDTPMTADQVQARAWARLESTTAAMVQESAALYPTLFPGQAVPPHQTPEQGRALVRAVLNRIADDHPDDDTVIAAAETALAQATAFVEEHRLVRLPDEPVHIVVMPEFKRGVAIAYCNAAGPLEQQRETFYEIAPPPADWPTARRESFYREYNDAMLVELTLHEAVPGHFLQLAHAAEFPSPVRSVFDSGTFVEGWAVYSEGFMADAGFGGPAVALQRHKMVLRLSINAILDHGVHAGGMTREEALALMMERGFQEEGEALGKWKRAQLTSAQLSTYLVGLLELEDLRRAAQARDGAAFDLGAYHDALLSHGSPPPRHLWTLLGLSPAPVHP
jgi:uncharacterized protein (DUF885 family)